MRSPDTAALGRTPFYPLLAKELWEVVSARALWTLLMVAALALSLWIMSRALPVPRAALPLMVLAAISYQPVTH